MRLCQWTSQSVAKYRQAIKNCGVTTQLNISWGLDRDEPEWDVWKANADTLRLDTDVKNDGYACTFRTLNTPKPHTLSQRIYIHILRRGPTRHRCSRSRKLRI